MLFWTDKIGLIYFILTLGMLVLSQPFPSRHNAIFPISALSTANIILLIKAPLVCPTRNTTYSLIAWLDTQANILLCVDEIWQIRFKFIPLQVTARHTLDRNVKNYSKPSRGFSVFVFGVRYFSKHSILDPRYHYRRLSVPRWRSIRSQRNERRD